MADFNLDAVPYPHSGYVHLTWDDSEETIDWYEWRVYRSLTGEADWTLIHSDSTPAATYEFKDYLVPSGEVSDYVVVEASSTDGGQTVNEQAYTPVKVADPHSDKYWLIHPTDESLSMVLHHVTGDSFSDEDEEAVLNVIGRGRKIDRGEHWGKTGTLSLRFRDHHGITGRQQFRDFLALKQDATFVYLRNPFGDVLKVALGGSPSTEREAGIGHMEHHTVSVPYTEVA